METQSNKGPGNRIENNSGRVIGGIVLLMVGLAIFARQMDLDLPHWLFRWPMILIVIGVYLGGRQSFRLGGWIVPIIIGAVFITDDILDNMDLHLGRYLWPSMFVLAGLYMILRPRRNRDWSGMGTETISSDDLVDATAIFGGTKRNIISKNFKGGEVSTFFGGNDLDLSQADIQGTAVINISTAFGGTKLILPSHWNLQSEVVCIFGGLDDKRKMSKEGISDPSKTLILKGTCIFGGIDIKSY
jgi:predicted membrane protein